MPEFINGYAMPKDPRPPFNSGGLITEVYSGYCVLSKSCERRGLFLMARDTFNEVQQLAFVKQ